MSYATEQMQQAKLAPGVNKGGRPDKVGDWHVKRAQEYINGAWKKQGDYVVVPTLEGLAMYLDVSRQTLYEASELSYMRELVNKLQAEMVLNHGLQGTYNAAIAKLVLSKHGYREATENVNVNVDVTPQAEQAKATATQFADYLKQSSSATPETPTLPANTEQDHSTPTD